MNFDVKYHIQAEAELKRRKQANAEELNSRRAKLEQKYPELARARIAMATAGAKLVATVLEGGTPEQVRDKLALIQQENTVAAARLKELLMKAKFSPDYLEPIYSCKTCRDTGLSGEGRCACYINTVKRLAARDMNAKSPLTLTGFESFDVALYPDTEQDGCNVREVMRLNYGLCRDYAEEFHLPNTGLLLSGKTGLGKTHLSLAIAGRVLAKGFNAIYGSAPDLFRQIENEHFGRAESGQSDSTADTLQKADLLVLDDIGAEFNSPFYSAVFYNLLNSRMNAGLPLIISTNLTMSELKDRYGERVASRLLTMEMLKFFGDDIRLVKLRQ